MNQKAEQFNSHVVIYKLHLKPENCDVVKRFKRRVNEMEINGMVLNYINDMTMFG